MEPRPNLNLPLTTADKLLSAAAWLVLLATWGLAVASYAGLPAAVPSHYNGAGQPDGYADKSVVLTLPFLATVLGLGLAALGRRPHLLNYPVPLTAANTGLQYANATRLLRYLRLALALVFGFTTLRTIQTAHGQAQGLGAWFTPLTLGLLVGPPVYFLVRAFRLKGKVGPGQRN